MTLRRALLSGLVLTCLGAATACTNPSTPPAVTATADTPAQRKQQLDQLTKDLRSLPGATTADVVYIDADFTTSAGLRIGVTVTPTTDRQATLDAVRRLVWTSRINPLSRLSVDVVAAGAGQNGRDITLDEIAPAMTAKYGPRPVPLLDR